MEYVFCHNPYFNRWFSAIIVYKYIVFLKTRHNPYFNRWFSAIVTSQKEDKTIKKVTILILIDGFLQSSILQKGGKRFNVTILILIDGFLQFNIYYTTCQKIIKSQSLF